MSESNRKFSILKEQKKYVLVDLCEGSGELRLTWSHCILNRLCLIEQNYN